MRRTYSYLFFICLCGHLFAQKSQSVDSLNTLIKQSKEDTSKVNLIIALVDLYENVGNYDKAVELYKEALPIATKTNSIKHIVFVETQMAFMFIKNGEYDKATPILKTSLDVATKANYKKGIAQSLRFTAAVYLYKSEYEKATEYYLKAQKVWEEIGDTKTLALGYSDLGIVNYYRKNFSETAKYWEKSLEISKVFAKKFIANDYNNLGLVYIELKDYSKAELYFKTAMDLNKQDDRTEALADNLNNLGKLEYTKHNIDRAIDYFQQSLVLKEKNGSPQQLGSGYYNIAEVYREKKDLKKALEYSSKAVEILEKYDNKDLLCGAYGNISVIYFDLKDYEKAYTFKELYADLKDTLLNSENLKQMNELEKKYETAKKDTEIQLLSKDKALKDTEIQKQQSQRNAFIVGFVLLLLLAGYIFKGYKQKQKANLLLEEKNNLIEIQKKIVEEKNKDITDSINYARRIQAAILPSIETIHSFLPDAFVLYKPKDIVSGDFYWFAEKNGYLFIAAADCTGHGVPGAFMSMIGNDILTQIIIEKNIFETNEILTHLHEGIRNALKQDVGQGETKDGMDIAIVRLRLNPSNALLQYSGALRPLWVVEENSEKIQEYKPDKHSVGGAYSSERREFTSQELTLSKGSTFYMTTDGYADQFGGEKGKKFKYKKLQEIILSSSKNSMQEQKERLNNSHLSWKGNLEQVDDILIIGVRI